MRRFTILTLGVLLTASTAFARSHEVPGVARLRLLDGQNRPLKTFQIDGKTWVLGQRGQRFKVQVCNAMSCRVEAVVSVDGRDTISGRPATRDERGWVIRSGESLEIPGWQQSSTTAATFRFSSVPRSYAARMGDDQRVGMIGALIFPELQRPIYRATATRGDMRMLGLEATGRNLGTEYGESRENRVTSVSFTRQNPTTARAMVELRYTDRAGLLALGLSPREIDGPNQGDLGPFTDTGGFAPPPPRRR